YGVVGGAAVLGAAVFLVLPTGHVARQVLPGPAGAVLFAVACACWALFQLQDSVLAALGRARWVPLFNGAFGVVRVVALPVLGIALGALGVLLSWVVPTIVTLLVAGVFVVVLLARAGAADTGTGALPTGREVVSYLAPTYLATIGTTLLYNSIPLLVVSGYGNRYGATFFIIWTGLNTVDYGLNGFVNSLVLRGSHDAAALPHIVRTVARRLAPVVAVGAVLGAVLAPYVLALFGHEYATQGATALRIVLVGIVARVPVTIAVGASLAGGNSRRAGLIQASSTVLILIGVWLAPHSLGLAGPAIGFLVAQLLVAALVAPPLLRWMRRARHDPAEDGTA
ncbi:MAG: hypothetical protein WCA46_24820, partial [Actinocatenispora sp.]